MGKNQSASGLINVIQYDSNGNVSIVSGSTTLMQVSSSGQIYTTGTISGSSVQSASLAQNSNLLQGTGSVGFVNTGSFSTASGSVSSRITQIENVYATTGSNSFRATQSITGSLTVTGQIIAQTINVQQVTSSIVYSSGSNVFGCDINSRQTFTGSFYQTGSVAYFSNCVGIGTTSPNGFLQISTNGLASQNNPNIRLTDNSASGNGGNVYISADKQGVGYNNLTAIAYSYTFKGGASATNYLTIDTTGVSCFAGAICAPTVQSANICTDGSYGSKIVACGSNVGMWVNSTGVGEGYYRILNGATPIGAFATTGWYKGSSEQNLGIFADSGRALQIATGGCSNARLTIDTSGISTFACQVCAPVFNSTATSYLNGLVVTCNVNSNCFTGITVVNSAGAGAEIARAGIAFQGYDWVQSAIWHGRNAASAFAGALLFGTNPDTTNLTVGGVCTRLKIDNNGVACFSCTVCAKSLITTVGGLTENFDATGGGHVNRYFAAKYISENSTSAFFKITTSGASATYINLVGTNSGVGWYSSQVYHAANSAYWGGWIGSGSEIQKIGTSAGYISGTYSDGSGGQIFCVTVANNGTSTSSLIFAYITTVTYAGYSTSFTQL